MTVIWGVIETAALPWSCEMAMGFLFVYHYYYYYQSVNEHQWLFLKVVWKDS
jgi:hypothetical protein